LTSGYVINNHVFPQTVLYDAKSVSVIFLWNLTDNRAAESLSNEIVRMKNNDVFSCIASCDFRYHGDSNEVKPGTDDSVWEIITEELTGFSNYFAAQKSVAQAYNDGLISIKVFQT
jgi:hypothetical protein